MLLLPRLPKLLLPFQKHDDPFLPFSKAIIDAIRDLVCAYQFDLAAGLSAFLLHEGRLRAIGDSASIRLDGEEVLYAGQREDFAERARADVQVARL